MARDVPLACLAFAPVPRAAKVTKGDRNSPYHVTLVTFSANVFRLKDRSLRAKRGNPVANAAQSGLPHFRFAEVYPERLQGSRRARNDDPTKSHRALGTDSQPHLRHFQ